jgi:hypothetical protein
LQDLILLPKHHTLGIGVHSWLIMLSHCGRTTSENEGFASQDHIRRFSMKRECANTHI